jgi:hypothetical protein
LRKGRADPSSALTGGLYFDKSSTSAGWTTLRASLPLR